MWHVYRDGLYSTQRFLISPGDLGHSDMYGFEALICHVEGLREKVQCKIILAFFPSWEHREVRNTALHTLEITGNMAHSLHKHS